MYGKFFSSTFTGSMYGSGVEVFAVWGYVIANTVNSRVELNPMLLASVLGTTPDKIEAAIAVLCGPDGKSRSTEQDGRRLVREGQFQYFVVNHETYRAIRNEEDRRVYNRDKQRESRARRSVKQNVIDSQSMSTMSAHTEAEAEAEAEAEGLNQDAWDLFVQYRKDIRKPYKKASINAARKKLAGFGKDQMAVVEQTIANGWTGLFYLKRGVQNGTYQQIDNSAVGKVRRANHERERRNAERQADGASLGKNGDDVRTPLVK